MNDFADAIRSLPAADKLLLVDQIWEDLTSIKNALPISDEVLAEAKLRRDRMMADPNYGKTHEEVWGRIEAWRNG